MATPKRSPEAEGSHVAAGKPCDGKTQQLVRLTLEHGESESSPANSLYVIVTGELKAKRQKKR